MGDSGAMISSNGTSDELTDVTASMTCPNCRHELHCNMFQCPAAPCCKLTGQLVAWEKKREVTSTRDMCVIWNKGNWKEESSTISISEVVASRLSVLRLKNNASNQQLIEHLESMVLVKEGGGSSAPALINHFIQTIEGDNDICYTLHEKLPGEIEISPEPSPICIYYTRSCIYAVSSINYLFSSIICDMTHQV